MDHSLLPVQGMPAVPQAPVLLAPTPQEGSLSLGRPAPRQYPCLVFAALGWLDVWVGQMGRTSSHHLLAGAVETPGLPARERQEMVSLALAPVVRPKHSQRAETQRAGCRSSGKIDLLAVSQPDNLDIAP